MKQTTIWDFLDEVVEEANIMLAKQQAAKDVTEAEQVVYGDETPTKLDDVAPDSGKPLIEVIINNFLDNLPPNELPTLEQAKTIAILDSILSKYNAV